MDADWSVELGPEDAVLEFPWSPPDGTQGFVDLSRQVDAIAKLPEVVQYPELNMFLITLNSRSSPWLTAKCDVWIDDEIGEAEEIYEAKVKVGSYFDLVRHRESERFSFEQHEQWAKSAAISSRHIGMDKPIACEFVVRRCWYHSNTHPDDEPEPGFYMTLYVFGYGNDEALARAIWRDGLTRVTGKLLSLRA